ncbi:MAG: hypothetical protein IOC63_13200 [Methylobacterium sp.]|nr:hypothetical protein [Methylobacterium sp.]
MKTSVIVHRSAQSIEVETVSHRGRLMVSIRRHFTDEDGIKRPSGTAIYVPISVLPRLIDALSALNGALAGGVE